MFADDKTDMTERMKLMFGRVENIVGKGEKSGYQHFLLFLQGFQKASYTGGVKSRGCVAKELKVDICYSSISFHSIEAEPHSFVCSISNFRTRGHLFNPWLGQYFFRRLTIFIVTVFIPLSMLSVVSTMAKWESSQWLGKNIVQSTG